MNRPPTQPRRTEIPEEERPAYDAVVGRMRKMFGAAEAPVEDHFEVGEYFGALLNSPPMTSIASQMGTFVRLAGSSGNSYSHADREFVDQVLSADWKTNVVQGVHIPDAVGAGVRLEAIEALRYGHEEDLNEDEQLLARFIRQVVSGTVDDETYGRIEDRLGTRGLVEYTGFILWLQWIMRMMQALGTADLADEEVDRIIAELRAGSNHNTDYESRLA
jgi:truncated hemoglobin YjbI